MKMQTIKINYGNCENVGTVWLYVFKHPDHLMNFIPVTIKQFKKNYPFNTSANDFIKALEKIGIHSEEIEPDYEV